MSDAKQTNRLFAGRRTFPAMAMWLSVACLACTPALAQNEAVGDVDRMEAAGPPAPRSDDFDWMQLTNGEWLKGEIKDLQDDTFVFESDELDTQTFDWEDVHAVYSPRANTVMLRDKSTIEGSVVVEGDSITVTSADGVRTVSRSEVRSLIPGRQREINYWSGKLSLGTTIRQGNVDQTDISGQVHIERRDPGTRLALDYTGAYGTVDGERTVNSHRGTASYDIYVTDRFYVRPFGFEAYRDEFQNIDYRLTPSAGAGYDLIDTGDLDWAIGAGAGWQFTRFEDPAPGQPKDRDSFALLANTRVDWEATDDVDVFFQFDLTVPLPDSNDYNFRARAGTAVDLWRDLELDVQVIWDHVNNPEPSGGDTPEPDDVQFYLGVGWEF